MRRKALALRIGGASYEEIGESLGVNASTAWRHVVAALEETRAKVAEDAEKVRAMEIQRLDAQLAALWGKRSDPRVSDTILRVGDRRAKLLGLDAPVRSELSGPGGGPLVHSLEVHFIDPVVSESSKG